MNDAAFQSLQWAIDAAELIPVDRMDVQQSTRDGHAQFLQEARAELANARKLLEVAVELGARYADGLKSPIRMWAKLADAIAACRAEAGKNQNA